VREGRAVFAATAASVLLCGVAHAQWLNYPTPGIPRLSDGAPNLAAPTPRAPDGRPDLSGIWRRVLPAQANSETGYPSDYSAFLAPGSRIDMLPWAAALYKTRVANFGAGNPGERCLPKSFQNQILLSPPMQVIQNPGLTVILFEEFNHFRQILTDGRGHPSDPNPSWFGYSVGRWEADTFVVDTIGFRDDTWLDGFGHPGTPQLRTLERFRRRDFGHLELVITIEDPTAYVQPWTANIQFDLLADTNLLEYVCENNRYVPR
jgi:hypothetical protein